MTPQARIERWLDEAIIGLDLCPFAAKVRREGSVRIRVISAGDPLEAVQASLEEAYALLTGHDEGVRTTLVAISEGLEDFDTYLDVVATLEEALAEAGAQGTLQVASFHPDYRFEGEALDGVSHFTNRAPYPLLHLLREDDVSEAVDRHPDPEGIPQANIQRLEAMGITQVRQLWRCWSVGE